MHKFLTLVSDKRKWKPKLTVLKAHLLQVYPRAASLICAGWVWPATHWQRFWPWMTLMKYFILLSWGTMSSQEWVGKLKSLLQTGVAFSGKYSSPDFADQSYKPPVRFFVCTDAVCALSSELIFTTASHDRATHTEKVPNMSPTNAHFGSLTHTNATRTHKSNDYPT